MKMPSHSVRILVHLFCVAGIMSCQHRKPAVPTALGNHQGKPDPVSTSDMKSMEQAKEKM